MPQKPTTTSTNTGERRRRGAGARDIHASTSHSARRGREQPLPPTDQESRPNVAEGTLREQRQPRRALRPAHRLREAGCPELVHPPPPRGRFVPAHPGRSVTTPQPRGTRNRLTQRTWDRRFQCFSPRYRATNNPAQYDHNTTTHPPAHRGPRKEEPGTVRTQHHRDPEKLALPQGRDRHSRNNGQWPSLVRQPLWERKTVGSNPACPTEFTPRTAGVPTGTVISKQHGTHPGGPVT